MQIISAERPSMVISGNEAREALLSELNKGCSSLGKNSLNLVVQYLDTPFSRNNYPTRLVISYDDKGDLSNVSVHYSDLGPPSPKRRSPNSPVNFFDDFSDSDSAIEKECCNTCCCQPCFCKG